MNVEEIRMTQRPLIVITIVSLVIAIMTNYITFEEAGIETLNIIINTIAFIVFLITAWVSLYYYGKLEANGEKVFWESGILIVISGIIPGAISFLIGKHKKD